MKKIFNIINVLAVVLTVVLVSMSFLTNFSSGNKIYKNVYTFANNTQMSVLISDIEKASYKTNLIAGSILNYYQQEYLTTISETIEKLNNYFTYFSINLSQEKSKSNEINQILNKLTLLKNERNSLILDLDEYLTKLEGNTQGRLETSFDYLLSKSVNFLHSYSQLGIQINNIITYNRVSQIEKSFINLHLKAISKLSDDYKEISFTKNSISVVNDLNSKLSLTNNNFSLLNSSIYSSHAKLFNDYFKQCNIETFINNYLTFSILVINPTTEKDIYKLAYYYFDSLTEVIQ